MNLIQNILIVAVRLYRCVLSPAKTFVLGPAARCRFEPSCSEYALQALQAHGAVGGTWLAAKRLCRCHPWGGFGPDPVPAKCSGQTSPIFFLRKERTDAGRRGTLGIWPAHPAGHPALNPTPSSRRD